MKTREGKIFDIKPQMTLAMKLAASFAITYYGLLLVFEVIVVVFRRYYFDSYYFNQGEMSLGSQEFIVQIIQLALSITLVFSLIQIFRKKTYGKAIFVSASLLLIFFQIFATGLFPLLKYFLEVLMLLIITPIRIKKKIRIKKGKLPKITIEPVETTPTEEETPSESIPSETEPVEMVESIENASIEEEISSESKHSDNE